MVKGEIKEHVSKKARSGEIETEHSVRKPQIIIIVCVCLQNWKKGEKIETTNLWITFLLDT